MPASPDETSATERPSAARASAWRTRASSEPSSESKRSARDDQRRDQIEIERIADRRVAGLQQATRLRRQPVGPARADADRRRGGPARGRRGPRRLISGASAMAQVTRRPLRLATTRRALRPGSGQSGALGHAVAADLAEHGVGGISQARRFGLKLRGREEAGRHAEIRGGPQDRVLVGLQVDRGDAARRIAAPGPPRPELCATGQPLPQDRRRARSRAPTTSLFG